MGNLISSFLLRHPSRKSYNCTNNNLQNACKLNKQIAKKAKKKQECPKNVLKKKQSQDLNITFHSKVYLIQTLQALFYEQKTFWVTPKRTCLSVICSSVVGQLRWKEHIKKYKKFLIFPINKLDFISLRKIRNNDRTIEYIIQAADIHFG